MCLIILCYYGVLVKSSIIFTTNHMPLFIKEKDFILYDIPSKTVLCSILVADI